MPSAVSHALVLTSRPGGNALERHLIDEALRQLRASIGSSAAVEQRWLCELEAWEAPFGKLEAAKIPNLRTSLIDAFAGAPVDVNIVPAGSTRRKKLLIADMDSTIIEQECIDEIADFASVRDEVADITERAMRGELDFEAALRKRVALLKGLSEGKLQQVIDERLNVMPGARTAVQTMRANGAFCALVSGGFSYFTSRMAQKVGFHVSQANELQITHGALAGAVDAPILGREAKLAALERYTKERGLTPDETLAVGDGANDIDMIKAAGLGVAYRAKPLVAAEAGASIIHGDLTALLYLQGYRHEEFVEE